MAYRMNDNGITEGHCRKCRKKILWVKMKSGKNMPVDPALHGYKIVPGGKERIVTPTGEVVSGIIVKDGSHDGIGYISHFASCDHAKMFRKK